MRKSELSFTTLGLCIHRCGIQNCVAIVLNDQYLDINSSCLRQARGCLSWREERSHRLREVFFSKNAPLRVNLGCTLPPGGTRRGGRQIMNLFLLAYMINSWAHTKIHGRGRPGAATAHENCGHRLSEAFPYSK